MSIGIIPITDPFRLEEQRSELAKKKNYSDLKKTYSPKYPEIDDQNTPKLWDKLNFEVTDIKTQNPMMWDRIHTVAKSIPKEVNKVLDIGFGGGLLEDIVDTCYDWHGIDISPKSVKSALTKHPGKHFRVSQITDLKFPKDYFDCVIVLEVMEHIPPRLTFTALSQIYKVLKPGGRLIVSVPLNEGLEHMNSNPNAHVRVYTPALIEAELNTGGFKVYDKKFLYAFHRYYYIKKLFGFLKHPNIIILLAQKQ